MRQVVLDTETTGLEVKQNHRVIEIGCVELQNRKKTRRVFHQYLNPEREIDDGAFEVHGISNEQLKNKPRFIDVAEEFIEFIKDCELIIHNAPFDVGFLDNELQLAGKEWGSLNDHCKVVDTLVLAREKHPGQKNSLDALCQRYSVDNSQREQHGALLDAQILADVYLAMTGGQTALSLEDSAGAVGGTRIRQLDPNRLRLKVAVVTDKERSAHLKRLQAIDKISNGNCLWKKLEEALPEE